MIQTFYSKDDEGFITISNEDKYSGISGYAETELKSIEEFNIAKSMVDNWYDENTDKDIIADDIYAN